MTSLFSTDPFFHSPSYDESSPDLSILQELEMDYANESNMMMAGNFLPTEEDVYSSPLSDASPISDAASPICDASPIPPFTVISPYDPIPTPTVKTESTITHHIPILPFQSVTATRTAKKRRRFAGNPHLRSSDEEEKDDVSIGSSDSQSSSSSPTPTTTKKRKSGTNPAMGKRERNKVSASKYRKRRKMYLDTLEEKTNELEQKYVHVSEQNTQLDSENRVLKEQLAFLKSLLHTKGADMNTLEQTLQGDLSQTTPQQSSIFMFVLFSCFLLFNPMTWFTSTPSTSSNSLSSTRHITFTSRPSSVGHPGRTLLEHKFDTEMEMEMEDIMSKYDFVSQSIDILPKSMQIGQMLSQGLVVPTSSQPTSIEVVLTSTSAYVPLNDEPVTSASSSSSVPKYVPLTASSAVHARASPPKHQHVPLTGEPAALLSRRDVDIDDPIRVHRVMQPVDKVMQPVQNQPLVINETALSSKFNETEVAAVREIIDMTKDTVDINDMKQLYQHVLTPLIHIMGETRAREAIQTLAQGILDIHLDSTDASMTRSGQAPAVY